MRNPCGNSPSPVVFLNHRYPTKRSVRFEKDVEIRNGIRGGISIQKEEQLFFLPKKCEDFVLEFECLK